MTMLIDFDKCTGCGRCLRACAYQGVVLTEGKARLTDRCTLCRACVEVCPEGAISPPPPRAVPDFSDRSGVWVLTEIEADDPAGRLKPVSLELLGCARRLAEPLGGPVAAVLIGRDVGDGISEAVAAGADRVHVIEHELLERYSAASYTAALAGVIESGKPEILLIGATLQGRDLAPRLTRRLGLGLTADCTKLEIDPETRLLVQTRPAFGGDVMASIVSEYSRPQTATVRPGIMDPPAPDPERVGEVVHHEIDVEPASIGSRLIEFIAGEESGVDITRARVVIAGGRGVGSKEGFELLYQLAELVNGEVGGTRAAVEAGWIPPERQIGQTGVHIKPDVYIACGISGAVQHRAGIDQARCIVAVNKDPNAVIFESADYGLVADYKPVVSAMIKRLSAGKEGGHV